MRQASAQRTVRAGLACARKAASCEGQELGKEAERLRRRSQRVWAGHLVANLENLHQWAIRKFLPRRED